MKKFCLSLLCLMTLGLICLNGANAMIPEPKNMLALDVATLETRLSKQTPMFLLDVREPSEFQAGHIKGAVLIPLGTLPQRLNEIPKDKPVVVICRSGHRSVRATAFLMEQGYKNAENLTGGMIAWAAKCETNKNFC